jgi:hypothetical protein
MIKRITFLIFIAIIAFAIVLWVKRPDIIGNLWLWVVGLAGPVIAFFKRIVHEIDNRNFFRKEDKKTDTKSTAEQPSK